MGRKFFKAYERFNLYREKNGFPTVSRREFIRLMSMASAGLSIPLANACGSSKESGQKGGEMFSSGQSGQGGTFVSGGYGGIGSNIAGTGVADSGTDRNGGVSNAGSSGTHSTQNDASLEAGSGGKGGVESDIGGQGGVTEEIADSGNLDNPNVTCPDCSRVGITRNADTISAVRTAIDLAGGLSEIVGGDSVVIKPNISTPTPGVFTSLPVIEGIVEAVAAHTSKDKITIAECTAMGLNTRSNATVAGYIGLVERLGINFLAFDEGDYVGFQDPRWTHITTEKRVPESLMNGSFDHFISAPILKNHQMVDAMAPGCNVEFTCCMKLFVGILPYRGPGGRSDPDNIHTVDLGDKVAELGCIVPTISMCVVDALRIGILGGPTPTRSANAGLIIASKDRVACDSLAFATLKHYGKINNVNMGYVTRPVWEQAQIRRGGELGLGFADPEKIEIIDQDVDNLADIMTQWV